MKKESETNKIASEIKKIIKGDLSLTDEEIEKHSKDTSIFKVKPEIIIYPKNKEDIKKIINYINKNRKKHPGLNITTRAGGTCMSGGPLGESIILNLTRYMNKISKVNQKEKTIIVQPGAAYKQIEKNTLKYHLHMPTYPASKHLCAIGGMVANNSGGELSIKHGKTQHHIKKLKIILADGKEYTLEKLNKEQLRKKQQSHTLEGLIYRQMYSLLNKNYEHIQKQKPNVTKNSAGYYLWDAWDKQNFDLTQIIAGSQGTLGIITEIELKLTPKPKNEQLIITYYKSAKELSQQVPLILKHKPDSLETFDKNTLNLAIKFLPEIAKKTKQNTLALAASFWREALITLKIGRPEFTTLVQFNENSKYLLRTKTHDFVHELKKQKIPYIIATKKQAKKYWTIRRESFTLLRKNVGNKHAAAFIDDFVVKPEYLHKIIPKIEQAMKKENLTPTFAGHAGSGNYHIIPLMNLEKKEEREKIPRLSEKVYKIITKYGGSITAEHNDGIIRTPYLPLMFDKKMINHFKKTKQIFDPHNIFNPGKKVGGSKKYLKDHIKTK